MFRPAHGLIILLAFSLVAISLPVQAATLAPRASAMPAPFAPGLTPQSTPPPTPHPTPSPASAQQIAQWQRQDAGLHMQLAADQGTLQAAQASFFSVEQTMQSLGQTAASAQSSLLSIQNQISQTRSSTQTQLQVLQQKLVDLYNQAEEVSSNISVTQDSLTQVRAQEQQDQAHLAALDQHLWDTEKNAQTSVRAVYVLEQSDPLLVLFESTSFDDLLTRLSTVASIFNHDKQVANQLAQEETAVQQAAATVQDEDQQLRALQQQYEDAYAQLQRDEKNEEAMAEEVQAMERQKEADLQKQAAQVRTAQQQAMNQEKTTSGGYLASINDLLAAQSRVSYDVQQIAAVELLLRQNGVLPPASANGSNTGQPGATTLPSGPQADRLYLWPLYATVTQEFGPSQLSLEPPHIYSGTYYAHFHTGIDIAGPLDSPITAPTTGTIIYAGPATGFGILVMEQVSADMTLYYGHIDDKVALPVKAGDQVNLGQTIAYEGTTGWSTGPHLHFEIRINGVPVNPRQYLPPY